MFGGILKRLNLKSELFSFHLFPLSKVNEKADKSFSDSDEKQMQIMWQKLSHVWLWNMNVRLRNTHRWKIRKAKCDESGRIQREHMARRMLSSATEQ